MSVSLAEKSIHRWRNWKPSWSDKKNVRQKTINLIELNGGGSDEEMDDDALLAELDGLDEEYKGEPATQKKPPMTQAAKSI